MLLDEIKNKCSPELISSRDYSGIAAKVSEGRVKVVKTLGGIGAVMEKLGTEQGAMVLDSLDAQKGNNPGLKWGWYLLEKGELDFGSPVTRNMIDSLFPVELATVLKSIAEVPDEVDEFQVRQALWSSEGVFLG